MYACLTLGLSVSLTNSHSRQILTVTHKLPPRRLLAVAAALALIGNQAEATGQVRPKSSLDGSEQVCPLGTFHCAPRPYNYAICRPNALLDFYDPALGKDPSLRNTSPAYVKSDHVDSSNQTIFHSVRQRDTATRRPEAAGRHGRL
jgi:hypothetical protein